MINICVVCSLWYIVLTNTNFDVWWFCIQWHCCSKSNWSNLFPNFLRDNLWKIIINKYLIDQNLMFVWWGIEQREILGSLLQNFDLFIILKCRNLPFRFDNKLDGRSWRMKIFFLTLFSSEINWHQKNQIIKIYCSHFSNHFGLQTGLCEIAIGLHKVQIFWGGH